MPGWGTANNQQQVFIDFEDETNLPTGWDTTWNEECDSEILVINYAHECTATYHTYGGTSNNPTKFTGKDHIILEEAVKKGYTFINWYDNPNFTGEKVTEIAKGTIHNLDFYAKYDNIAYKVKYDPNPPAGTLSTGTTESSSHEYEVNKALTANGFRITGWHFTYWTDNNGVQYNDSQLVSVADLPFGSDNTLTIKANWDRNNATFFYNSNRPNTASNSVSGNMNKTKHTYGITSNLKKTTTLW